MSNVDVTKPVAGNPTTSSVRDNMQVIKDELEAFQSTTLVTEGDGLIGVKSELTGAIATTVHLFHKYLFKNVFTDFGVVSDGVTDDQAAWNLATASGATMLYFPAGSGNSLVSAAITGVSNLTIWGEGTIEQTTASTQIFNFASKSNIKIDGIHLKGESSSNTEDLILFTSCSDYEVVNCHFTNYRGSAITSTTCSKALIADNYFTDGIQVAGGAGSDVNDVQHDIEFNTSATDVIVRGNRILSGIGVGVACINTTDAENWKRIEIHGNIIKDCRNYGIMMYSTVVAASGATAPLFEEISIHDNTITDIKGDLRNSATGDETHGAGIYLLWVQYFSVKDNNLNNTNISTANFDNLVPGAIGINDGAVSFTISGNQIHDAQGDGISLAIGDDLISGKIENNNVYNTTRYSCRIRDTSTVALIDGTLSVENNHFIDATLFCFLKDLIGSFNLRTLNFKNNTCTDNAGTTGVEIDGVDNVYLYDNHLDDINGVGFDCKNITNLEISGNTTKNVTGTGRGLQTASTVTNLNIIGDNNIVGGSSNYVINASTNIVQGYLEAGQTILANDATPSVKGLRACQSGGTTTITDFDDGYEGQIIYFMANHAITITDGTNIFLNGSANFVMASTDTLTLIQKNDGLWYEIGRSDNT